MDIDREEDNDNISNGKIIKMEELTSTNSITKVEIPKDLSWSDKKVKHMSMSNDDNEVITYMGTQGLTLYTTRCTIKISFTAIDDAAIDCMKVVKAFFK